MCIRMLTICLATMLIASCVTRGSAPVVVDIACDSVKPIYLTVHDIAVMEKQTKRDVLTYNKAWNANCSSQKVIINTLKLVERQ